MSDDNQLRGDLDYALTAAFWEKGQALGFPIQFHLVLKHLRQDMRDDWYFDCLQYDDLFKNPDETKRIILSLLQEWNGAYRGTRSVVRNIPKKGYGERYGLETDFFDRFIYQAICSFLIPYYDRLLSHRVLSYRYDSAPSSSKYLFKNKIDRWFTFEGVTLTFVRSKQYLLVTDLSNFFENISRSQVIEALENSIPDIVATGSEKLHIRNAIGTLDRLLEQWMFSGDHGLPQNRDASAFFSNILLSSVDQEMAKKGYDYYRYVDDIRVLADTELQARRALQDLIRELRRIGLNINASKTEILPPTVSKMTLATYFPSQDGSTVAINQMWQSRSRRIVTRSVAYIFEILTDCIAARETQTRQFRFAVNRVAQIVESGLFDVGDALSTTLLDTLSRSLSEHAVSTDQYCRLIATLDRDGRCLPALEAFLLAEEGAIHDWQNYNIWMLLGARRYRSDRLVELAGRKITEDIRSGEAAAVLIWLRCIGETAIIRKCIEKFDVLPYQNARYFLIASSVLHKDELKPLHGHVPICLKGTGSRAERHANEEGLPFAKREKPDLLNLVDEVSEYD
ncbi:RNA-directed DNA polymerase [Methylobacterium sp. E-005]|uniref:RNA-directed DNA polymerase n=1 Tax=Methylobacterium sp. E-005 TaxID=2836549 RepID=UPI001FBB50E0|nr:RNA-directed DNA polymerase [Methylobacterium sp. E-005]MCJ2088013.1 RNA-directed DNA polymerase [Methylobacterium sp. E-005]